MAATLTTPGGSAGVVTGQVLQLARRTAGLSQETLAELRGVSLDSVQGWESGRRRLAGAHELDARHELAGAGADPQVMAALEPADKRTGCWVGRWNRTAALTRWRCWSPPARSTTCSCGL